MASLDALRLREPCSCTLATGGYARAAVAAPIVVHGSWIAHARRDLQATPPSAWAGFRLLRGAAERGLVSFRLVGSLRGGVLITAESTYWCLLTVSAVLAIVAEAQLLLDGRGGGAEPPASWRPYKPVRRSRTDDIETPAGARGGRLLLHRRGRRPGCAFSLAGCTPTTAFRILLPLATPGSPGQAHRSQGDIAIGPTGKKLSFQIVHHKSDTTMFKLSAAWMGTPSTPLAKSITFSIGPNQTFQGTLSVPPLPDGCTYRIGVDTNCCPADRSADQRSRKLGRSMLMSMIRASLRRRASEDGPALSAHPMASRATSIALGRTA